MLGRASNGSNSQLSAECVGSLHTSYVDEAKDDNFEDEVGVTAFVNDEVGALMANTSEDFDPRRDDRLGDVVDLASTILVFLLSQLRLSMVFAASYWTLVCENFKFSFRIASSDCVMKAMLVRSAYGSEAKCFLILARTKD